MVHNNIDIEQIQAIKQIIYIETVIQVILFHDVSISVCM